MKLNSSCKVLIFLSALLFISTAKSFAQQSGSEFRRSAVMDGNLVKSVYGNWGVIGQPSSRGFRGAWLHPNNGYIGDVSIMVGAEVNATDEQGTPVMLHSVVVCPVDRPASGGPEQSPAGKRWGFEPVGGYFNANQEEVAISNNPNSWPASWPDKLDDPFDPGWPGSWNGFFGRDQFNADLESYFVMDDANDEEFNVADFNRFGVEFVADSTNPSRHGLGLEVRVRALQWNDVLAQDNIFWLYEVTNMSATNYNRVVFGSLVGTYVGVTSTEDRREYDDDFSFFDVTRDLTYTADFDDNVAGRNPNWVGEVGVVGYAFLESPGNPFDGIDNDGDADEFADAGVLATAPFFESTDFDFVAMDPGKKVVVISNDGQFTRTIVTIPDQDTTLFTLGTPITIRPGITELIEGNTFRPPGQARTIVNPNAYDGIDNDLDGIIDENSQLHYRQVRIDQNGNVLFDILNPLRYVDYVNNLGLIDPMLDEARDDGADNDNDWESEFDDVGLDGKANTGDTGEGDGIASSGRGTDRPGEPHIDKTDVDESDQIGLSSFEYFAPAGNFSIRDDESLWQRLVPGFFDVPSSIVNGRPIQGEDGDFIFGSGYFPLPSGQTRSFSLALVFGEGGGSQLDFNDLFKNLDTVQKIFNSNYQFPQAPRKPVVQAFADDGKVTLYWDNKAEESIDPVTREKDFEGYRIHRSTDPDFNDARIITNADGTLEQLKPIAQFDLANGITGYFQAQGGLYQDLRGLSFFLGDDTGLQHSFVDHDVENGRTYYYAVVSYDRGDEASDIFPKENTRVIRRLASGKLVTDVNTAIVTPQVKVAGYKHPPGSKPLTPIHQVATGDVNYQVLDENAITGHIYTLEFFDTSNDGIDNNGNWDLIVDDVGSDGIPNTNDPDGTEGNGTPDSGEPDLDQNDPKEFFEKFTTSYSVKDSTGITESLIIEGDGFVDLSNQNIVPGSVSLFGPSGSEVPESNYILQFDNGRLRTAEAGLLPPGQYSISYKHYPVFRSTNLDSIQRVVPRSESDRRLSDTDNFDGLALSFRNAKSIGRIASETGFNRQTQPFFFSFVPLELNLGNQTIRGFRGASDYRFEFSDDIVDTSSTLLGATAVPVNFRVLNVTGKRYLEFLLLDQDGDGTTITTFDELVLVERDPAGNPQFTWDIQFSSSKDTTISFGAGDTLLVVTSKPFRRGDLFLFVPEQPTVDPVLAAEELPDVRVVPNPYVVASVHEPPLPAGVTSGRGERRITFTKVPPAATIHIFTSRGEIVRTIYHDDNMQQGSVTWNLKTEENLDVSPGVYFYVVDSEVGKKRGKIAIIK
jgi:hypothetical protein